jgi:hypothetical protein
VNIKATHLPDSEKIEAFDLYYPVSPRIAILLAMEPPDDSGLSDDAVREYNRHIQWHSHKMLFAHDRQALTPFMPAQRLDGEAVAAEL